MKTLISLLVEPAPLTGGMGQLNKYYLKWILSQYPDSLVLLLSHSFSIHELKHKAMDFPVIDSTQFYFISLQNASRDEPLEELEIQLREQNITWGICLSEYHGFHAIKSLPLKWVYFSHLYTPPQLERLTGQVEYGEGSMPELRIIQSRMSKELSTMPEADLVVANSYFVKDQMTRHQIFDSNRIFVVQPGVDKSFWVPQVSHLADSGYLYFGRISHLKGASNLVGGENLKTEITIVGADLDICSSELGRLLSQRNDFSLLPWMDDSELRATLARFNVALFPSLYEPWGLSLNQALSAGMICFAQLGAGGHDEQIEHGRNGFLIDFNKSDWPTTVFETMEQIDFAQIGYEARLSARSIEDSYSQLEDLFQFIMAKSEEICATH